MTDNEEIITSAQRAPEHAFIKPEWGLTAHIPEGTALAWGARAIYRWASVKRPVLTPTGRQKMSRGRVLTETTFEPTIEFLHDRMGWSRIGTTADAALADQRVAMSKWINDRGLPEIKRLCRQHDIQTNTEQLLEFAEGDYKIVANTNGSCGYLYIAAWRVVQ